MLLALLHPVVLGAALRVQGDVGCPSPSEVSAGVQAIVDLSEESAANVHATLRQDGAWLELDLAANDGTSLGKRRIEAGQDCSVLARTAAVMLAAWLSEEHPEFLLKLPSSEKPAELPPTAATSPAVAAGTGSPKASSAAPAVRVAQSERSQALDAQKREPSQRAAHRLVLGAAIGGSASGTQFAPGAWLGVAWDPVKSGVGLRLAAAIVGSRSEPLQQEQAVRWTRWPLLAGPYLRLARGSASFEIEAGPALGWLRLEGENFSHNSSYGVARLGSYAAFRFVPREGRLQAFVMAVPMLWFGHSTATATSSAGEPLTRDLPAFEILVAGGVQLPL